MRYSGPDLVLGDAGDTVMTDKVPASVPWNPHSAGINSCAQATRNQGRVWGRGTCDGGRAGRVIKAQLGTLKGLWEPLQGIWASQGSLGQFLEEGTSELRPE